MSLEAVEYMAFRSCTSLTELDIPPLTGNDSGNTMWYTVYSSSVPSKGSNRLASYAFYNCTHLTTVRLLAGGEGSYYFPDNTSGSTMGPFQNLNSKSGLKVVNYNRGAVEGTTSKGDISSSYTDSDVSFYYAVTFYDSEEDGEADTGNDGYVYREVWPSGTSLQEIVYGDAGTPYETDGEEPELSDDEMWYVEDGVSSSSELSESVYVFRESASANSLTGGYVEIDGGVVYLYDCEESDETTEENGQTSSVYYGTPDLSGVTVYRSDGTEAAAGTYEIVYLHREVKYQYAHTTHYNYVDVTSDATWAEGTYSVYAVSTSDGSTTGTTAQTPTSGNESTTDTSDTGYIGEDFTAVAVLDNVANVVSTYATDDDGYNAEYMEWLTSCAYDSAPTFRVLCSADNWQYNIIANSLAAVGGGNVVTVEADDTNSDWWYIALSQAKSGTLQQLGYDEEFPDSVVTALETYTSSSSGSNTRNIFPLTEVSGADELAVQVYNAIADNGEDLYGDGATWGDTAIVLSGSQTASSTALSQYAYLAKAPVFFTAEDGTVGDSTLEALSDGGFSQVIVAGDGRCVSEEALEQIEQASGVEPQRVEEGSACEACLAATELIGADSDLSATLSANDSETDVVIADAADTATAIAACNYACATGAALMLATSEADVKRIEEELYEDYFESTVVYVTGAFEYAGGADEVVARVESVWDDMEDTELASGDTLEDHGVLYELDGEGGAAASGLVFEDMARVSVAETVSYGSAAYAVDGLGADLLAGNTETLYVDIDLGDGSVADGAFAGCTGLLGASVSAAALGSGAFAGCASLESASLELTAASPGSGTFEGCTALASLALDIGALDLDASLLDDVAGTLASLELTASSLEASALQGNAVLQSAALDVASIAASALEGCTSLAELSTTASSIGGRALYGCASLESAELSSTELASVAASTFQGCPKLASVSIASTALTSVGAKAFYGCEALGSISLKSAKLTSVGDSAFCGCGAMTSATISSTALKTIGASAFQGCSKLASVSIASTALTSVGSKAFYGCKALKSISLKSKKLTSIGASAFYGCSAMTSATLSSTALKTIGASAFQGCSKLASVSIASTALTSVGSKAFYGCKALKSVSLKSKKLKTIGASAFQGCSAMTKATLSSTKLTSIGSKSFYGCKKLKTLTIKSKKLKKAGSKALKGTYKKLSVKVPSAKVKAYKKLLKKAGLPAKATVKKG